VSREVFSGDGGRKVIDDTIRSLDSAAMPDDQKRLLRDMLESVQRFNAAGNAGAAGRSPGISLPYVVQEEAMTARQHTNYNGYAHSFAGMGLQFMLMGAINFAIEILVERQRGLWKRLRSAPISKRTLLGAKVGSGTIIGTLVMLVSFGFAILVWGVRIEGSVAGFIGVTIASALMAASYGLLVAALGKTPNAARGASVLATLIMVMLGGAWVPTFVFPAWLQRVTLVMPTRWAVDGFDAMTWRGFGLSAALLPMLVLLGFAAVFWLLALARFRWEEV
jgi:ABC-2 type transport system permease protein